jgi:signal transduction histidine kinase
MPEQWLEIVLYNVVGWVTGLLSQRQKDERDRYRRAAEELDRAYAELKDRARILVETEEQLRLADRLSALGQLSAGLAHEIKTPLASIRGAAEILARTDDSAEREEFSSILEKEVDRLNQVVVRFLDFARPRGEGSAAADLAEAVDEVLRLVRLEGERRGVAFECGPFPKLPRVAIDPEQLRQVILNLVMNALQAMDSGGRLIVRARPEEDGVRLVVADTGPGIAPELRARIFEPFYTTRARGTGLGLSIVKKILMNHGATIDLSDREGGGTEIEMAFPRAGEET